MHLSRGSDPIGSRGLSRFSRNSLMTNLEYLLMERDIKSLSNILKMTLEKTLTKELASPAGNLQLIFKERCMNLTDIIV